MRHTLYANNRQGTHGSSRGTIFRGDYGGYPGSVGTKTGAKDKVDMILEAKINAALKKHDGNNEILTEIQDKVTLYCINVSVAREYEDKTAIRKLRRDLINYLNTKN